MRTTDNPDKNEEFGTTDGADLTDGKFKSVESVVRFSPVDV